MLHLLSLTSPENSYNMTMIWASDDPIRIERNTRPSRAPVLRRLVDQSLSRLEGGTSHLWSKGCRPRFSGAIHPPRRRRLDRTIGFPSSTVTRHGTRGRATRSWGHGDDGERLHAAKRDRIVPASRAAATRRAIRMRGGSGLRQHVYGNISQSLMGSCAIRAAWPSRSSATSVSARPSSRAGTADDPRATNTSLELSASNAASGVVGGHRGSARVRPAQINRFASSFSRPSAFNA